MNDFHDSLAGQAPPDNQVRHAGEGTDFPIGQEVRGAHDLDADGGTDSPQASDPSLPNAGAPAGDQPADGQVSREAQGPLAVGSDLPTHQSELDAQLKNVGGDQDSATTIPHAIPNGDSSSPDSSAAPTSGDSTPTVRASGSAGSQTSASPARPDSASMTSTSGLADATLALLADVLDDFEDVRKANESRLRQLIRTEVDSDGEARGFGLDESHPDVARLAGLVDGIGRLEHQAVLNLQRAMRRHWLGPWVKSAHGIGEKQAARLLAAIGDPYIRPELEHDDGTIEPSRPRMVSELWKYAGYKPGDKRRKGVKVNWSTKAKTRAWLIAEKCVQTGKSVDSEYYRTYAARKAATEGRLHAEPCAPCGKKGTPAEVGTPWRDGHRHQDALRIVAKAVLRDLWRESKRLHELGSGQAGLDLHMDGAAADQPQKEHPAP